MKRPVIKMSRFLIFLGLPTMLFLLSSCAITQEGLTSSFGSKYGANHFHICLNNQAEEKINSPSEQEACSRELLLIGRTSVLRLFKDTEADKFYIEYAKLAAAINPTRKPDVTYEEFRETYVGWTRLKFEFLGAVGFYEDVLVSESMRSFIDFASSVETFAYGGSSDLVAARTNSDGFFIIEKVLCKRDQDFHSCATKYPMAIFDAKTGLQLDPYLQPLEDGLIVNLSTYQHR